MEYNVLFIPYQLPVVVKQVEIFFEQSLVHDMHPADLRYKCSLHPHSCQELTEP